MKNYIKICIFVVGLMWTNYPQTAYSIGVALPFHSIEFFNTIDMNNQEIWKDVKGYKGLYQASDLGNIKSLSRYVNHRCGKKIIKERILKPIVNHYGYLFVNLFKKGIKKTITVHQLVAIAFLNHTPNGHKLVCNHINFNKQDNRVENLEIVTNRENTNKKHLKSTSKYTGVSWDKPLKKWAAYIHINIKKVHLGYYTNEYDAHLAYQNALLIKNNLTL